MIDGLQLPPHWSWASFGEVADVASDLVDPTLMPDAIHIAPNHIEPWTGRLLPFATVAVDRVTSPKHRFRIGQVLYSKIRPYLAKAAFATFEGVCSADMYPINAKIDSKYLLHWILTPWFTGETARNQGRTILPKINRNALDRMPVPVAPLREQRRIVEKIEELFSDLDAGVAALKRARANLKRYRASVLKAAVEGKLTAEWRAKHQKGEPASKLLERILKERRRKWEADQLAKFAAAGKQPPKNCESKYVEPSPPGTADLPDLPKGWTWVSVEQVSEFARYGSSAKTNTDDSGVPVLRMGNIVDGSLNLSNLKYLPKGHSEFPYLLLAPGDLLFNRTNSAELVGKSAVYDGNPLHCSYASYLIAVRCLERCNPHFLCIFLNSGQGRQWVKSVVSQQVGQANVNGTKLQSLAFPLPPLSEQTEIVDEVAEALSQIGAANVAIDHGLLRATRLRQSILRQAFEGKLVPQDASDEPACVLLQRLRNGHSASASNDGNAAIRTRGRRIRDQGVAGSLER